jgi:hypothetical protein
LGGHTSHLRSITRLRISCCAEGFAGECVAPPWIWRKLSSEYGACRRGERMNVLIRKRKRLTTSFLPAPRNSWMIEVRRESARSLQKERVKGRGRRPFVYCAEIAGVSVQSRSRSSSTVNPKVPTLKRADRRVGHFPQVETAHDHLATVRHAMLTWLISAQ